MVILRSCGGKQRHRFDLLMVSANDYVRLSFPSEKIAPSSSIMLLRLLPGEDSLPFFLSQGNSNMT